MIVQIVRKCLVRRYSGGEWLGQARKGPEMQIENGIERGDSTRYGEEVGLQKDHIDHANNFSSAS